MQLTDLAVENVRRFVPPHALQGLGPGLNVLAAPNESGKSTLLAALLAVLFQKHDSRTEALRSLVTAGSETAPRISIGFAIGAQSWRLEKRFLSRPSAVLVSSDGARFEGDEAETRLRALLGVARSGKTTQIGLWSALWVEQGRAFAQAELGDELTRTTLTACLEQELGHVAGYGDASRLLREAEQLLAALRDKRGARRGRGAALAQELRLAEEAIEALVARRKRLGEDIEGLIALKARAARRDAETLALENAQALVASRAELEAAVRREVERDRRAAARDLATRARQGAEARIDARRAALGAAADAERAARRATERSEAAAKDAADAEAARVASARALQEAEHALDACVARGAALLRAAEAGEARARQEGRLEILRRARRIEAEIADLTARLAADKVDDAALGALRKALAEADALRARLAAQATSVSFALRPGAPPVRVTQGAAPPHPPGTGPIDVVEQLTIEIEGVGVIEIRPATIGRGEVVAARARAEDALRSMLAACGAANLAEAEALHAARTEREAALRAARAELARLVPGDEASGLPPGTEALAASIAAAAQHLARAGADLEAPEDLAASLHAAREEEAELRNARATARARHERALTTEAASRATAEAAIAAAEPALRAASERAALLAAELGAEPDSLLEAQCTEARREEARAIAEAAHAVDGPDSETLRHRVARLEEAEANRATERRALGERIAAAQGRIEEAGGTGIEEALADEYRKRDAAARELDSLDRDAEALTLLCATLRQTIDRARATTLEPLTRRIAPLVSALLPGAEVFCDEKFQVGAVTRGTAQERFELLSDGTREQIAVLARIALADLLLAAGRPASIVLDDALAFSDPERIERMFDILHRAAARMQIIVLTCRDDVFGRLGGRRLELVKPDDRSPVP